MSSLLAFVPWILFAVMVVFGAAFSIIAWRASGKARKAESEAERLRDALAQMEQRAQAAESQIQQVGQRAGSAEQQIAQFEREAQEAKQKARQAEERAREAEQRAESAYAEAQRADAQLRERQSEAQDKARKAETRARSLLDWARQQWMARQESDRSRAQAIQGSFQAQLDAYLDYRRAPVTFRVESEIDQLAAPHIPSMATSENVRIDGQDVRIEFPVDPSKGFRA